MEQARVKTRENEKKLADKINEALPDLFPKELRLLLSSYAIVPQTYSFEIRGHHINTFEHDKLGLLSMWFYGRGVEFYSENQNWKRVHTMMINEIYTPHGQTWNNKLLLTNSNRQCIDIFDIKDNDPKHWHLENSFGSFYSNENIDKFYRPGDVVICGNLCYILDFIDFRVQCYFVSLKNEKCTFQFFKSIKLYTHHNVYEGLTAIPDHLIIGESCQISIVNIKNDQIKTIDISWLIDDYITADQMLYSLQDDIIVTLDLQTNKIVKRNQIKYDKRILGSNDMLSFVTKDSIFIQLLDSGLILVVHKSALD